MNKKNSFLFLATKVFFVHITLFYFIGRRRIRNDFIVSLKLQFVNHRKLYDAKFSQASFGHGILRHTHGKSRSLTQKLLDSDWKGQPPGI